MYETYKRAYPTNILKFLFPSFKFNLHYCIFGIIHTVLYTPIFPPKELCSAGLRRGMAHRLNIFIPHQSQSYHAMSSQNRVYSLVCATKITFFFIFTIICFEKHQKHFGIIFLLNRRKDIFCLVFKQKTRQFLQKNLIEEQEDIDVIRGNYGGISPNLTILIPKTPCFHVVIWF